MDIFKKILYSLKLIVLDDQKYFLTKILYYSKNSKFIYNKQLYYFLFIKKTNIIGNVLKIIDFTYILYWEWYID